MTAYTRELEAAIAAVQAGLSLARAHERAGRTEEHVKAGVDIVTDADVAAEDAIRAVLLERCPELAIVGEERGGEPAAAGAPYWLVDPICGTRNYASQLGLYATNLALVVAGRVQAAAVGDGTNGGIYAAVSGGGAFVASEPGRPALQVRAGTVIALDLAGKPPFAAGAQAGRVFAALVGDGRFHVRMLGTTLPFAKLATGDVAGLLMLAVGPADPLHTAAGCALAEAAGAIVTDGEGRPWTLERSTLIAAATPELHATLLATVKASGF